MWHRRSLSLVTLSNPAKQVFCYDSSLACLNIQLPVIECPFEYAALHDSADVYTESMGIGISMHVTQMKRPLVRWGKDIKKKLLTYREL